MTLPSSGGINLSQIKTEFSGPNNLLSYYRGGTYVANISNNSGIPTSGTIKITDFYSAAKFTLGFGGGFTGTVYDSTSSGMGFYVAGAQINFVSDGSSSITTATNFGADPNGYWGTPAVSNASNSYRMRIEMSSFYCPSPSGFYNFLGTTTGLSSSSVIDYTTFGNSQISVYSSTNPDTVYATGTIRIKNLDGTPIVSTSFSLTANWSG